MTKYAEKCPATCLYITTRHCDLGHCSSPTNWATQSQTASGWKVCWLQDGILATLLPNTILKDFSSVSILMNGCFCTERGSADLWHGWDSLKHYCRPDISCIRCEVCLNSSTWMQWKWSLFSRTPCSGQPKARVHQRLKAFAHLLPTQPGLTSIRFSINKCFHYTHILLCKIIYKMQSMPWNLLVFKKFYKSIKLTDIKAC